MTAPRVLVVPAPLVFSALWIMFAVCAGVYWRGSRQEARADHAEAELARVQTRADACDAQLVQCVGYGAQIVDRIERLAGE